MSFVSESKPLEYSVLVGFFETLESHWGLSIFFILK